MHRISKYDYKPSEVMSMVIGELYHRCRTLKVDPLQSLLIIRTGVVVVQEWKSHYTGEVKDGENSWPQILWNTEKNFDKMISYLGERFTKDSPSANLLKDGKGCLSQQIYFCLYGYAKLIYEAKVPDKIKEFI